jgi:hypothetical protein
MKEKALNEFGERSRNNSTIPLTCMWIWHHEASEIRSHNSPGMDGCEQKLRKQDFQKMVMDILNEEDS